MKLLNRVWAKLCLGRQEAVGSIRVLAVLAFVGILGALLAREFHKPSLGDFCNGMAVSFSGILMLQVFGLRSAEPSHDPQESPLTELHLSR